MSGSSGEKTEQPTDKRLRDARKRGQISKSQDLTSAVLLVAAIVGLWFSLTFMGTRLAEAVSGGIKLAVQFENRADRATVYQVLTDAVVTAAWVLLPLTAVLFVVSFAVSYLQVGSLFAFEALKPSFGKINPAENFKQKFFKSRPYIELAKTVIKMIIAAVVALIVLWSARADIVELTHAPLDVVGTFTAKLIFDIGIRVGIAFLVLGAGDWFLQKFLHLKDLKMTKEEVKREYKEQEGDPLIKFMRKQIHQEILSQSAIAAVKTADAVVVNPTHVAVAIKYDRASDAAPHLVAKGADLMAQHIRELAAEAGVPIMRDIPLARALYELEIDQEVPEGLYEAVATVLRWVYEMAEERHSVNA